MLVTVRALRVDDVFVVARLLAKAQVPTAESPQAVGLAMLQSVVVEGGDDVKAWLADLCGMTAEEFGKLPPDALLDCIEQLKAQDGIRDFFSRAARLAGLTTVTT